MKTNNTTIANTVTIGGITGILLLTGLPLAWSIGILGGTVLGCGYLTVKEGRK